ncbi:MAG: biotin/lipoyl-containing protein [Armatimonadota bacterium]
MVQERRDPVKAGEPLLEVMTDKVNMEVESPETGVLRKYLAQNDDIVPVKDPICIIGSADESIDDLLAESAPAKEVSAPSAPEPVAAAARLPSRQLRHRFPLLLQQSNEEFLHPLQPSGLLVRRGLI